MKTSSVIRDRRPPGRLLTLFVLLIALFLVGINQAPSAVAAKSAAQSAIVTPSTPVPMPTGTLVALNNSFGNQTNPHINCDRVLYTNDDFQGSSTIHYFDFSTGTDSVIPGNEQDRLADVYGMHIALTEINALGDYIVLFDTTTQTRSVISG